MLTSRYQMMENTEKFLDALSKSLADRTFVKLSLGNYRGTDKHLQKILIRLVNTRKGNRLYFLYRGDTRDTAKNFDFDTGVGLVAEALESGFFSGHLFTIANDLQLEIGKKGKSRLNIGKPTFKALPSLDHDREKTSHVDVGSFYLKALGITDDSGRVRDKQQDKWRQINKFVEVLASLVDKSALKEKRRLSMIDMGSGKGYLTFAAYDHFKNVRGVEVSITGIDTKAQLIDLSNEIAKACGFDGLHFVEGTIADFEVAEVDVLIALHACNTATDDAIFKGISANAQLIVAAPCCHQEVRPQIKPPEMFAELLRHGVMLERFGEMLTDGIRTILLERSGYATKLFEFVSTEHTPKNNMLVGTRMAEPKSPIEFQRQLDQLKGEFGITHQRLETLLNALEQNRAAAM